MTFFTGSRTYIAVVVLINVNIWRGKLEIEHTIQLKKLSEAWALIENAATHIQTKLPDNAANIKILFYKPNPILTPFIRIVFQDDSNEKSLHRVG